MLKKLFLVSLVIGLLTACASTPIRSDKNYVYYEIFVGSFYDTNEDGMGDLKGVEEKLPYLNEMGVGGIWLMPINPSPTYHKYDVTDYKAIDPKYGTMEDFDNLIAKANEYKIDIIIDLVLNHSSSEHPWFTEAKRQVLNDECDLEPSYCDYYVFSEQAQGKYYPIGKGYYYEALFWDKMPDFNLDNPKVREEFASIMKFWLDKGVKGFRLDAVTSFYNQDVPRNNEFLAWVSDTAKSYKEDAYIIGEAWSSEGTVLKYYQSGVESFFNFGLSASDGKIASTIRSKKGQDLATALVNYQAQVKAINPDALDAPFISNHDQGRSAAYFKSDQVIALKQMASLYLLMPGRSFIYYGEEIAMRGSGKDENKRLPMIWSLSDKTGQTLGPSAADYKNELTAGVGEQLKDKNSLLNHYKNLTRIKNTYDVITEGDLEALELHPNVYAIKSSNETEAVIVIHNLAEEKVTLKYDFSEYKIVEQIYHLSTKKARLNPQYIEIEASNSVVLQRK